VDGAAARQTYSNLSISTGFVAIKYPMKVTRSNLYCEGPPTSRGLEPPQLIGGSRPVRNNCGPVLAAAVTLDKVPPEFTQPVQLFPDPCTNELYQTAPVEVVAAA
jgi:hypothetical protein